MSRSAGARSSDGSGDTIPDVEESTLAAHIHAATANAANRVQNYPYLGRRPPLLRRLDHGLYVRASEAGVVDGGRLASADIPGPGRGTAAGERDRRARMPRRDRARSNVEALVADFDGFVRRFEASAAFSGPSVYFHQRAIERRMHSTAAALLADELFLEYVYAVLPSWGMHRMGGYPAKVTEFGQFAASLRSACALIEDLWPLDITRLDPAGVPAASQRAWQVIAAIRASASETQIVAGSKTLHHVLPCLIPPIDRQYTFRFFTGQKTVQGGDRPSFTEWFPYLAEIGSRCRDPIDMAARRGGLMGTGPAKVIDNAIIGFMQAKDATAVS